MQFETIQKLEEQKIRFQGEVEVLTLGLHDAEQRNDYLQKETPWRTHRARRAHLSADIVARKRTLM